MVKTAIKEIIIVYIIRIFVIGIAGVFSGDDDNIFAAVMIISDIVLYYRLYILKPQEMKHPKIKINYIISADCILWTGLSLALFFQKMSGGSGEYFLGPLAEWSDVCLRLLLFVAGCAVIIVNAVVHLLVVI